MQETEHSMASRNDGLHPPSFCSPREPTLIRVELACTSERRFTLHPLPLARFKQITHLQIFLRMEMLFMSSVNSGNECSCTLVERKPCVYVVHNYRRTTRGLSTGLVCLLHWTRWTRRRNNDLLMLSHSEQTLRSTTRQPLPERTATGFGLEGLFSESQLPRTRLFLGHALQHLQRLLPITRWGG